MKEMFQKAMVVCAAIATFSGGTAAIVNGASSLVDLKVNSLLVQRETAKAAAEQAASDAGVADTIVTGVRKLMK